jgi:serine protease Do
VKDARELARTIGGMAPGASIKLGVLHKGSEKTLTLTLGELPNAKAIKTGFNENDNDNGQNGNNGTDVPNLGLTVAPAKSVAGAGKEGVVVTAVNPDGASAERGLKEGDVILEVAGKSVATPDDVRKELSTARADNKNSVLIRIRSGDSSRFVALPVGKG